MTISFLLQAVVTHYYFYQWRNQVKRSEQFYCERMEWARYISTIDKIFALWNEEVTLESQLPINISQFDENQYWLLKSHVIRLPILRDSCQALLPPLDSLLLKNLAIHQRYQCSHQSVDSKKTYQKNLQTDTKKVKKLLKRLNMTQVRVKVVYHLYEKMAVRRFIVIINYFLILNIALVIYYFLARKTDNA